MRSRVGSGDEEGCSGAVRHRRNEGPRFALGIALCLVMVALGSVSANETTSTAAVDASQRAEVLNAYGELPIQFTENQGQYSCDKEVLNAPLMAGSEDSRAIAKADFKQDLKNDVTDTIALTDYDADWWAQVQKNIAASEYHITWQEKTVLPDVEAAWQAPNRANNLRTYFTPNGLRMVCRTEADPSWLWGLELTGYGYEGAVAPAPAIQEMKPDKGRIEYRRGTLIEWYVNDARGLEQGFTIKELPAQNSLTQRREGAKNNIREANPSSAALRLSERIILDLAVRGELTPRMMADGQKTIEFLNQDGVALMHYGQLKASDASGRSLPTSMELVSSFDSSQRTEQPPCIRLRVDVQGAVYPVTVDPLITGLPSIPHTWTAESNQTDAIFGFSVATAGDVNGDGYADVIIGAPDYDWDGHTDTGRAYVYYGSAEGLSTSAAWTGNCTKVGAEFGYSVATAGDVNGDGYSDVIVGAPLWSNHNLWLQQGGVFVYYGSPSGLPANPNWSDYFSQSYMWLGQSVASAGDVNGDGYSDVIVGAPLYDNGEYHEGRAMVYYGSASGLTGERWWAEGNQAEAWFGWPVATAGDVNGDGYSDVIVGARGYDNGETDEGRALVYYGSSTGLSPTAAWTAEGDQAEALFGSSVATAGDVNGDGYSDVVVGAFNYDNGEPNEGRAFVYYGSYTGLSPTADWTAEGDQGSAFFGWSVAPAGDVNNDEYSDVIVGAYGYDSFAEYDLGRVLIYPGSAAGLSHTPIWTAEGSQTNGWFGSSVATAGDVNGDGYTEVIVGAPFYDNGQTNEGRAYVYYGSLWGFGAIADWSAESNQASADFGCSVATAGDVNGDGYADVIVGAENFDYGQTNEGLTFVYYGSAAGLSADPDWATESNQASAFFGCSVATAGDVNGDGFSDVIVGARWYENGESSEGGAFVYYGSAGGLSAAAEWSGESNQNSALYGSSVATAGDVNGDGYSDVIVGAEGYDNIEMNEGRAYVYHGSASGLSLTAEWIGESDQERAAFGHSVATAGDVNGDGYSDVIVGAYAYDNGETDEGGAFVYHGSASGLSTTPVWTAESNQAVAFFGGSVGTAGDVNGDGYADVIVGAYKYDGGQQDEGRAYVYQGSAAGLSATPEWTAESNQGYAWFGCSVGSAGDVNGDGYADVIVGAENFDYGQTNEGLTFVYYGSAAGLSADPDWATESDQVWAGFGCSVAIAGDVNGDGYSDIIVGARRYENGESSEGGAFVYYGSAGGLSAAAEWSGESDQNSAFYGSSVATAGDVNGDGYSDVIVGAHFYDNGETDEGRAFVYHGSASGLSTTAAWTAESNQASAVFGVSVATAGDVNGDGYSDVIVGTHFYDNGETDEGRAFVYQGSAEGLSPVADWTAEGNQDSAFFGWSVATAGDVNGDGYGDVIVGAFGYDSDEVDVGRVFVYQGSAAGLSSTPNWSAESDQIDSCFGYSVATAGDVNGDGFSDIIVGSRDYSNGQPDEGGAFVYHGSASGLASTADWFAEGNQVAAEFGNQVATAGDVNGDGYADVIIGAPAYDNGEADEGMVFVYHGSAAGLSASADWTGESNQAGVYLAYSVASAGDVNGDGYSDVIVGSFLQSNPETNEGRAYITYGSAAGLAVESDLVGEGNQIAACFGFSVATAGDVNGDGYNDVIVGAQKYDNGETDEGRAYVYYGNEGGLSLKPQQLRADDGAPVAHLGKSDSHNSFRLAMLARSPFGRGKVKLEWEVKPLRTLFDGTGIQLSTNWTDLATTSAQITELVRGLSADTVYHWRVRLRYHPATTPFQRASRWLTSCWNGPQEGDFRTAATMSEVEWKSLFEFARHWCEDDYSGWCDFNDDGTVDDVDLLELSRRWR